MNLEYYRNFVTIVDCGTISAAAGKLLIAQSALSTQIKTLEKTYGTQLLVRNARSVTPTDAGQILYEKSRYLIAIEDAAQKEISDCVKGLRGTLWLGLSSPPDQQLSQLFHDYSKANPGVVFEFYEINAQQLVNLLSSDIIEIAIIRASPTSYSSALHAEITLTEKLCAVYPRNNLWGLTDTEDHVPLTYLENVPLTFSKGFRSLIKEQFALNGVNLNIFSVSTTRETALMWARNDCSVAVVPCASPDFYTDENFYCCQLGSEPIPIYRCFSYLSGKKLSLIAQTFLSFAAAWLEEHADNMLYSGQHFQPDKGYIKR